MSDTTTALKLAPDFPTTIQDLKAMNPSQEWLRYNWAKLVSSIPGLCMCLGRDPDTNNKRISWHYVEPGYPRSLAHLFALQNQGITTFRAEVQKPDVHGKLPELVKNPFFSYPTAVF